MDLQEIAEIFAPLTYSGTRQMAEYAGNVAAWGALRAMTDSARILVRSRTSTATVINRHRVTQLCSRH
ncbi:hypothetical protein RvY_01050 [Ramazzottius varieornatus]|uniref:Uncharacterized protein n=1 Tax=Ramazzottius varieornatus TaxID=947166 RepID=A0A1D1UEY6_RAMVA|nr:hypothetical protein RvY_01050 [Ramazzottius varieornatus]